jgi:hypothetical protein
MLAPIKADVVEALQRLPAARAPHDDRGETMPARQKKATIPQLTVRDLKQRARIAGVTLPDDAWEPMTQVMNNALASLRRFDTDEERTQEPAVIFKA